MLDLERFSLNAIVLIIPDEAPKKKPSLPKTSLPLVVANAFRIYDPIANTWLIGMQFFSSNLPLLQAL